MLVQPEPHSHKEYVHFEPSPVMVSLDRIKDFHLVQSPINKQQYYIIILKNKIRLCIMTTNEKFKNIYENAYLQHIQIIKTNASIMKTYSSMFGNSEIARNIEKMESDFLTLNEETKKSMINQLDLIKDNYLSNAAKINEGYHNMPNMDKFIPNPDGSVESK
jgi:hypothetical protein